MKTIELPAQSAQRIPLFVSVPDANFHGEASVVVRVHADGSGAQKVTSVRFLGAVSPATQPTVPTGAPTSSSSAP
jgi:hypothetical protein